MLISLFQLTFLIGNLLQASSALALASKRASPPPPFWKTFKSRGVNLGNWLIIEKWMDPSWYSSNASDGGDEWTLCDTLGSDACASVLQDHWNNWVTEMDIIHVADMGINTLRIPVGFWAFIDPLPSEPYIRAGQLDQIDRILGYAKNAGIQVIIDLHALPGSQNGKDHSGHDGPVDWFSKTNQARSIDLVKAAVSYVADSPYKHQIAAIQVSNEPNITDSKDRRKIYDTYLKSAKAIIAKENNTMPMMFHDAFLGAKEWEKLFKASDNVVVDVHKYYIGRLNNAISANKDVCRFPKDVEKNALPTFVGEFSISVGGVYFDTNQWRRQFFQSQMQAWTKGGAGGAFWSLKAYGDDGVANNGWSFMGLVDDGVIDSDSWDFADSLC